MDQILNNILDSWTKCYNNHIFIENKLDGVILIDNDNHKAKSYYIEKTSNTIIYVNTKINHLVLNKCNDVILIINEEFISGLDIFHSNNIKIHNNIESKSFYSISFGFNYTININKIFINLDILLCVNSIYKLKINKLNTINKYNKFILCLNLFRSEPVYIFINNSLDIIQGFDTVYGEFNIQKY